MKWNGKRFMDKWSEHLQRSGITSVLGRVDEKCASRSLKKYSQMCFSVKHWEGVLMFVLPSHVTFYSCYMRAKTRYFCRGFLRFSIRLSQKLWTWAVSISLLVVNMNQGWLCLQALCITRRKRKIIWIKDDSLSLADLGAFGSLMFPP